MKLFKIAKNNKKPLKLNSIPNVKQKRERKFQKTGPRKRPKLGKEKKTDRGKD